MTGHRSRPVDRRAGVRELVEGARRVPATLALGEPPAVYGERLVAVAEGTLRRWDPFRSKLAAALVQGYRGPIPAPGERWLYLGAATGTTASHVADLVGRDGALYALERSPRPFARLLALAQRYPNLLPILADARDPDAYAYLVPSVAGVYVDIAQPDQVEIARRNAEWFLAPGGPLLLALKASSIARGRSADELAAAALQALAPLVPLAPPVPLEPFHRQHRFLAVRRPGADVGGRPPAGGRPIRRRPGPAGRRR